MTITLTPITADDVVPLGNMSVRDDQDRFIAPNIFTIAQARFHTGAYDFCIWVGDQRVGLIALIDMAEHDDPSDIDNPEAVYVWRLLIGTDFQGRGYGKAAMSAAENWTIARGKSLVQIQAVEDNAAAIGLYESLGYVRTGKMSDNEVQLEKRL